MDSAGASLFAGLSRVAELESTNERALAIARDLIEWGMRRVEVRIYDQWREVAQATAGESPLAWNIDPRPSVARALFAALSSFEDEGISVACGERLHGCAPGFEVRGDAAGSCVVFVQLIAATRVVGLIVIDTGSALPPGLAEIGHLRSYCDVAATLFDSERNTLRANRDAERSDVLARIAHHTRRSLDRRTMLELVVGEVREAFKAARCVIYERDRVNRAIVHVVALDDAKSIHSPLPRTHHVVPGSFFERVFEQGELVALERMGEDAAYARARSYGMRALLSGPILADDGTVEAAVSIHYAREHQFDQLDVVLLRSITTHLGLALANAKLYEKEQQARRRAEMLERNLRTLRGVRTVAEILRTVTEAIVAEFGTCGSAWSIYDDMFRCEAENAPKTARNHSYAVGTGVAFRTEHLAQLRGEQVLLTRDDPSLWREVASKDALIAPLIVDRELWGFLAVRLDLPPGETDDDRAKFLATLAWHTALVLGNARAFEDQRRFALERSVLSEAGRLILTFNDPHALAKATSRLVLGLCGADRVEIYVPRNGRMVRTGSATIRGEAPESDHLTLDETLLSDMLESGATRLDNDGHLAILTLPSTDHIAGILACYRDVDDTAPFDAADIRFLESFGALLGLGLRNCELYEAETAANGALARSNEFKDDLLAMLTHDFKGPLAVIMGRIELLMEKHPGELRGELATIYGQAERLAKLADDAMQLARVQATEFELDRTGTDLNAFVEESLASMGSSRVDVRFPAGRPIRVAIDRARIYQVLENIVGNALKYSSGRVELRVELGPGAVLVKVADRGIGIPAGERDRIFTRFGRASNARLRGIAGSGVGLYTSRKIVEAHGGSIEVASTEDHGSTFTVSLPTLVAVDRLPAAAASG